MSESYACNVAGAVFNWLHSNDHGRGKFICRYFGISRSTLYRKVISFRHALCTKPGHPAKDETQALIRQLERKCRLLESEKNELMRALEEERQRYEQNIGKLTFMLIAIGLSGRMITRILRWTFRMPANHTDILKKAQGWRVEKFLLFKKQGVYKTVTF